MRKHLWSLFILLLLIGCSQGGSGVDTSTQEPAATLAATEAPADEATAVTAEPTAEPEPTAEASTELASAAFPATTVAEAAVIRESDWVRGATDPSVTIIEYGDFQ